MKRVLTLALVIVCAFSISAQSDSPVVKKYSKIHKDKKYIISETVFGDGHIENYITSVPVSELRKLKLKQDQAFYARNIEWDEDSNKAGLQMTFADIFAIQKAFNNALTATETNLGYQEGTMERIELSTDFLQLKPEVQSLQLINKVINALATVNEFKEYLPLEGVDKNISAEAKSTANASLEGKVDVQKSYDYENFEYIQHMKNDAIFLTNSEDAVAIPHIQAIYNWMFADQYAGWYNRELIFNKNKNNGAKGLNDDYALLGSEGFIGVGVSYGKVVNEIIANPTFDKASAVCLQLVDPTSNSKYAFELLQETNNKMQKTSILAVDE